MNQREFTNFLKGALSHLANLSVDGSIHFVCMDSRHMRELADAARQQSPDGNEQGNDSQTGKALKTFRV